MDAALREQLLALHDCYAEDTRSLVRFLDSHNLDLDLEGLEAYVAHLKERRYAASTINKRLQGAKNRLRLVFKQSGSALDILSRYQMETILKEIKGMKKNTKAVDVEKTLSLEEVRALLRSQAVPAYARLFTEFLVSTGVRISEATGIRLADLKDELGYVSVRIVGKGAKERYLKVAPKLIARIREHFGGATYLFETKAGHRYDREHVSKEIQQAGRALLRRNISAHTLRHTFATIQIRKNRKIKALSVYLGHASTSITQDMYVHEELDLEDLDMGL